MRSAPKIAAAAIAIAAVIALTSAAVPRDRFHEYETRRLRAHFDSVLAELRAADVTSLDASQRTARRTLMARLATYAAEGRFPHNHVRPGEFVPVFRDEHGTLCAMAFLIASTGRTDIVDDVARTSNLVYIPQLATDPRLHVWLDSVGLTVAEAARIQPQYAGGGGCCTLGPVPPPDPDPVVVAAARNHYVLASAGAAAINGLSMWLNLAPGHASPTRTRWTSAIGTLTGAAQLVYGALALHYDDSRRSIGVGNIAVGAASAGTAIWRMRHIAKRQASVATTAANQTK